MNEHRITAGADLFALLPLRVLLIEDSDDDAALVLRELQRAYSVLCERVETREAFLAALDRGGWDIIISDYSLPTYNGLAALVDLRERGSEVPFILVSGTIGEEHAVEAMKAGARDYVLKHQLVRLTAAVGREVIESRNRAERARLREQLILSERMASAGMMAAGVAHEINNPLAVVMANLDLIAEELEALPAASRPTDDVMEPLRDAREAIVRIRDIVRDVKLFSRPQQDERKAVDVERVIDSSLRMAQNEIRHRARVVKRYSRVPLVFVNEARLGQVVLNLIVNAAQAIPDGEAEQNEIRVETMLDDAGRIVFEVRDTGCGIPEENRGRVFETFFTTKPVGVGTGLGLPICQRIVTEMGGQIQVASNANRGTVLRVTLPAATSDQMETDPALPAVARSVRRARVLVIDDEEALGKALKRRLADYHDVTPLTSGREAIARITGGERYDVILSDLMMPDVTGVQVYAAVARIDPDQARRMVFLTGGAFTETARAFLETVPNRRLEKPVDASVLLSAIASIVT